MPCPVLRRRQQRTAERVDLRAPVVAPAEFYAAEDGGGCGAVVDKEGDDVGFRAACELGRRMNYKQKDGDVIAAAT